MGKRPAEALDDTASALSGLAFSGGVICIPEMGATPASTARTRVENKTRKARPMMTQALSLLERFLFIEESSGSAPPFPCFAYVCLSGRKASR